MFSAATKTDNVSSAANYIEDVFSTYLFSGNSASQTITNGIDLSGKGGMVWFKDRTLGSNHRLTDTVRGSGKSLLSNSTAAEQTATGNGTPTSFSSTGFVTDVSGFGSSDTYVTWTFREQAKFFDVVTYTGNGTSQNISHNLGSVPGCIIVKQTSNPSNWMVYHTSLANTEALFLNLTNAKATGSSAWNSTTPTSTVFSVGANNNVNASGETYVAYLFAHDAGGFGAAGSDNVISCGSFTSDGSGNATIDLGYEPQWILLKTTGVADAWYLYDTMRGITAKDAAGNAFNAYVSPNSANAETTTTGGPWSVNQTGFQYSGGFSSRAFIYIAIRRGPMRPPTSGTSVFTPVTYTGDAAASKTISTGKTYVTDWLMTWDRTNGTFGTGTGYNSPVITRLTGFGVDPPYLKTNATSAEAASVVKITLNNAQFDYTVSGTSGNLNGSAINYINWNFGRAPGFFDVVCYTGTGANRTVTHNLGVVPELMIVKNRSNAENWGVYSATIGNTKRLRLNATDAETTAATEWNNTSPTSSVFTVGTDQEVNFSGNTYVAYLFASCPGVSKVGSYTGTGALQTINCGFASGARFVLIKRTDSTGDWWVYDSARGITSGNDPYLFLNSTAAEVTNTNYVDTTSVGFQVTAAAPAGLNANGGTYLFLAIA